MIYYMAAQFSLENFELWAFCHHLQEHNLGRNSGLHTARKQ
jgi:hypothetical protein